MTNAQISPDKIELVSVKDLREHPFSVSIYGKDDHSDLVASIKELGVLTPLVIQGNTVISGHRRLRASIDAGLEVVPCIQRRYFSIIDEQEAILEFNRSRTKTLLQLFREGEALQRIGKEKGKQRQIMGGREKVVQNFAQPGSRKTRDYVASALGIGSGEQWRKLCFVGHNNLGLLEETKSGKVSINKLYLATKVKEGTSHPIQLTSKKDFPQNTSEEKAIQPPIINYGSFEEKADEIPDNSVGLIVVHYMRDLVDLDRWEKLASIASRVLVEGGFLIAYVSKMYLAEALWSTKMYLRYYWIICLKVTDSERWVQPLNVVTDWVPIIIFSKGEPRKTGVKLWRDSFSQQCHKKCDKWSSTISARHLIRQFSFENDTVLDPFAHKGEFLLAALFEGRRAFGYESNLNHYETAKQLLSNVSEVREHNMKLCPRPDCGGHMFREDDELFCVKCGYRIEARHEEAIIGKRRLDSNASNMYLARPGGSSRL